jgi:hypothetical protein
VLNGECLGFLRDLLRGFHVRYEPDLVTGLVEIIVDKADALVFEMVVACDGGRCEPFSFDYS